MNVVIRNRSYSHVSRTAHVVIVGGGIYGLSLAYNLAKKGCEDVVLLEKGKITSGTTWHAAGLLGSTIYGSPTGFEVSRRSHDIYANIENETGLATGYKRCGGLFLARTMDRLTERRRMMDFAQRRGIAAELWSVDQMKAKTPLFEMDGLVGGLWVPTDAVCDSSDVAHSLAKGARDRGVSIIEDAVVTGVIRDNLAISKVEYKKDGKREEVRCRNFVNCGGMWSNNIMRMASATLKLPIHPCHHYYLVTTPCGVDPNMPITRDPDGGVYFREWSGGILAGCFERHGGKPAFENENPIPDVSFHQLPFDMNHFQPVLDEMLLRMPSLDDLQIREFFDGPESFTPDVKPIVCKIPGYSNYFVIAGGHSHGIVSGGGFGSIMAEWILDGHPSIDMSEFDITRFVSNQSTTAFINERVKETLTKTYALNYPWSTYKSARLVKCSPLYLELERSGAYFKERMAYEVPFYFTSVSKHEIQGDSWKAPAWLTFTESEVNSCTHQIGVLDNSDCTKLLVQGRGCLEFLQYVCTNDLDIAVGSAAHTAMVDAQGLYKVDCSISRLEDNKFLVYADATQVVSARAWMSEHVVEFSNVTIDDVSDEYTAIGVLGPDSFGLISKIRGVDSDETTKLSGEFEFGSACDVIQIEMPYFEHSALLLLVPNVSALSVYRHIMETGRLFAIKNVGHYCLQWLRLRQNIPQFGTDFGTMDTPYHVGRSGQIISDKTVDFIGKEALKTFDTNNVTLRETFLLERHNHITDVWVWGGESVYHDNQVVGSVTSSGFDISERKVMFLAKLEHPDLDEISTLSNGGFSVEVCGKKYPISKIGSG